MDKSELPVFFDRSERRWKLIKAVAVVLVIAVAIVAVRMVPAILGDAVVHQPNGVASKGQSGQRSTGDIAHQINLHNTPVIGTGSLVRVVQFASNGQSKTAIDPFTGQTLRKLSDAEAARIDGYSYALERYGSPKPRQIALTFDDGPNPVYTPELLDLLSREHVPATFFAVGANVVKYPDITQRIVGEGHTIGNHSLTHKDLAAANAFEGRQEINQTQRIIRATAGRDPSYFRPPYIGDNDQGLRDSAKGILDAQKRGYTISGYNFDSNDWQFKPGKPEALPNLDGTSQVILLHDGGGDRSQTLGYVKRLIKEAKAHGYTFQNLDQFYATPTMPSDVVKPSTADRAALLYGRAVQVWPGQVMMGLFAITVILLLVTTVGNITLALVRRRRSGQYTGPRWYRPLVTVVVPAYNESPVLRRTVRSILASRYKKLEVIIVDDGSDDDTWAVARSLAHNPRVRSFRQANLGKAAALNHGLRQARGSVLVCVDADTIFLPHCMGALVGHFRDPKVGAVAGMVKVGNIRNSLTRWQALEYTIGIAIERGAQACLGAVLVVPGACGAWRTKAVRAAGGYSFATLAEDCDLTLSLQKSGYRIDQEDEAVSYTECPLSLVNFARQRFRWLFGNLQSYWKHRALLFRKRHGWLGMTVLPLTLLNTLLPLAFWPLLLLLTIQNLLAGNYAIMLLFLVLAMSIQLIVSAVAVLLAHESFALLFAMPLGRLVYGPLRTYLLFRSVLAALRGVHIGWSKFGRSGTTATKRSVAKQEPDVP